MTELGKLERAAKFAVISHELLNTPAQQPALERIVVMAVECVDPCEACGITIRNSDRTLETPAYTSPVILEADRLQYE